MTRDQYAQICSHCKNRKFDAEQGIVCGLTSALPNFETKCDQFLNDPNVGPVQTYERLTGQEEVGAIPAEVIPMLRRQQDLGFAIIGAQRLR